MKMKKGRMIKRRYNQGDGEVPEGVEGEGEGPAGRQEVGPSGPGGTRLHLQGQNREKFQIG